MHSGTTPENYPRDNRGFLDDSKLREHIADKIPINEVQEVITKAIVYAEKKSSRVLLKITDSDDFKEICKREGAELFKYFLKYCGDPASTAHACFGQNYITVGKEQFRNRTLQKQRMNSGWRYQYIAKDLAIKSRRFLHVSDLGVEEADFNAGIALKNSDDHLNMYISVKNRSNTVGGQDLPKAIRAIETIAKGDKNRIGPYICIFGIAMEKGLRVIRRQQKTGEVYSSNTEIWLSDFFWPFFSNYSYEEIIKMVLNVLIDHNKKDDFEFEIPDEILESFGECCQRCNLIDENGIFNDAYKLVDLFCGVTKIPKKERMKK